MRVMICGVSLALASCAAAGPAEVASCPIDYDARIAQEMADIDAGMAVFNLGKADADLTADERETLQRTYDLLAARDRPVSEADVAILDAALGRLGDEAPWDREDDRVCARDDAAISLYCALQFATEDVLGSYQHRRVALQEVRFALQEATEGKDYSHRLRDFNNDPDTRLEDLRAVIEVARRRVTDRLELQRTCAF